MREIYSIRSPFSINSVKASPHTMYSLASISKPITATGLMILVERGLIDLNKPANFYLGEGKLGRGDQDLQ